MGWCRGWRARGATGSWFLKYERKAIGVPFATVVRRIFLKAHKGNQSLMGVKGLWSGVNGAEMVEFASIIVAAAPMLIVYPFVQKYFEKGFMAGAVKG